MTKTIAVDTNVLIDYLFKRQPGFDKTSQLIDDCKSNKSAIFIPNIVFPELEWVLRSFYKQPKLFIIDFLLELISMEGVLTEDKSGIGQALSIFSQTNVKFTDAIILIQVQNFKPDEFLTFDEDLQKIYQSFSATD